MTKGLQGMPYSDRLKKSNQFSLKSLPKPCLQANLITSCEQGIQGVQWTLHFASEDKIE